MKKKAVFNKETAEIVRVLSEYKTLMYEQVIRMFPEKSGEIIKQIIARLIKQKRIIYDETQATLSYGAEPDGEDIDSGLITAFWVMADFLSEAEYHSPSAFPAQIAFFMGADFYEIISVESGKEIIMSRILAGQERGESNKIIVVSNEQQIPKITAENIFCFCIVSKTGEVEYYNFE
jgi:hypothetical protein